MEHLVCQWWDKAMLLGHMYTIMIAEHISTRQGSVLKGV